MLANITGCGIIRHIWCTINAFTPDKVATPDYLRKLVLRMYWDGEENPSVEAPIGDFFGKKTETVAAELIGAVRNLPVYKAPVAGQSDTAGTYPTKVKGYFICFFSLYIILSP